MALRLVTIRVFQRPRVLFTGAGVAILLAATCYLFCTGKISFTGSSELPSVMESTSGLFDNEMIGKLNYDVWRRVVGFLVDDLRISPDFPDTPEIRGFSQTLRVVFDEDGPHTDKDPDGSGRYGHKIYGYLKPQYTGGHLFSIDMRKTDAACSSEFWLSTDSHPGHIKRIITLEYSSVNGFSKPVTWRAESPLIQLSHKVVYYFEFLEKAFDGRCSLEILWKTPRQNQFHTIPKTNFAMAVNLDSYGRYTYWPVVADLLKPLPSSKLQSHHRAVFENDKVHPITDLDILPQCDIQMLFAYPHSVEPMTGVFEVRDLRVYPIDDTWYSILRYMHKRGTDQGNTIIDTEVITEVLSLYAEAFDTRKQLEPQLRHLCSRSWCDSEIKLQRMEQAVNRKEGSRFLLELSIAFGGTTLHTSEYVYFHADTHQLCHARNFQWTRNVDVFLVITVKNVGYWLKHFIHNMEDIYEQTRDEHLEVIVVDFESVDLDVEGELRKSSLKRWKVISIEGQFWKTKGLNEALFNYIRDPGSIVMTMDLHLTLSVGFVEYVRRHVIRGKTAFAPMFFRLDPGYTEINIAGLWETDTYGLFALYKADWITCGGFDMEKFTVAWGGEDWDIVDKAVSHGFEVVRMRYPGLVHYYHSKAGMWNEDSKKKEDNPGNPDQRMVPFKTIMQQTGKWGWGKLKAVHMQQADQPGETVDVSDKQPTLHKPLKSGVAWRRQRLQQKDNQELPVAIGGEPVRDIQPQYEATDETIEDLQLSQTDSHKQLANNEDQPEWESEGSDEKLPLESLHHEEIQVDKQKHNLTATQQEFVDGQELQYRGHRDEELPHLEGHGKLTNLHLQVGSETSKKLQVTDQYQGSTVRQDKDPPIAT